MNYIDRRHPSVSSRIIPVQPFDYVVFGATGDLTKRKLIPALFTLWKHGFLSDRSPIVGIARRGKRFQVAIVSFGTDLSSYGDVKRKKIRNRDCVKPA